MNTLNRRNNLIKLLPDKSLIILSSGKEINQSEDSFYPYYVNRNFYYLTNISQPNSYLVIEKNNLVHTYLYVDEFDPVKEKWFGKKLTNIEAKELSNIDDIRYTKDFVNDIKNLLKTNSNIYIDFKANNSYFDDIKKSFPHLIINNVYPLIMNLRMIKDDDEINYIKEAIKITHLGLKKIINDIRNSKNEIEVFNAFNHEILNKGTHEIGFPSIIATGIHTCCLHYPTPLDIIDHNSLILCDVGAAYNHYSSDITRTYPISGKYNDLQRKIYSIVLSANKEVINHIKPGISLKELQEIAKLTLAKGCLKEGLIKEEKELENYYFHNVSHHLGLDTHDASDKNRLLEKGMIITVEPGLYFKELKTGVRIEDDVLVTNNGHEVLTKDVEKEIEDIEKLF